MDWKVENNSLIKEFEFTDFGEAIKFVNKIHPLADQMGHHPNILIHSYNKVKIMLYTHSEDKITNKDYSLAKIIDLI